MKNSALLENVVYCLLMAALVALTMPADALAAGGASLGTAAQAIATNEIPPTARVLSAVLYVGGGALIAVGALKLKQHSENPTQTPMSHGLGRVAAGAALMAIPFFSNVAINTLNLGDQTTSIAQFGF